ncbi:NAD-dependent succinate-semialdehyde dehydrogenase [Actinomadura graeca]|uniref:NAD-dependent succinate-semialdehyde dehydrogenase n=1 Tax=Actinomadura graeca TaxID=2750812 RepID=UPI00235899EC|nr:NAD-dependent succinate-semialdehyde dehydrogenase [Actinomadura graeca]
MLKDPDLLREAALVGGEWISAGAASTAVANPSNGEPLGRTPDLAEEDVVRAIDAAADALGPWSGRTAHERAAILRRWNDLILDHRDDLARLMTLEQGKPLPEAAGEIGYAASFVAWYAEEATRTYGEVIPTYDRDRRMVVIKEPVGVCAAVTPWNFPSAMVTRKAAPALAAGCTMVLKPAPGTPFSALALAGLARRAGVPDGVLSVVTGDAEMIGRVLTSDARVRKLSFTGSTAVGRLLMQRSARTLQRVSLELGGNAPFLVLDDADVDAAVTGCVQSKFRNAGQTCVCANRVIVQAGVAEEFQAKLVSAVGELRVGDGFGEGVDLGPLIDAAAVAKVERHVRDAVEHGASVLTGGRRHDLGGTFFQPTVLGGVTPRMLVAHEETFGPLAPLFTVADDDEAVRLANATASGLAAYVYTRDIGRAWRIGERLDVGMVGVNTGLLSSAYAPFGGRKESGMGREGARAGIEEFLETKYLAFAGLADEGQATGR